MKINARVRIRRILLGQEPLADIIANGRLAELDPDGIYRVVDVIRGPEFDRVRLAGFPFVLPADCLQVLHEPEFVWLN